MLSKLFILQQFPKKSNISLNIPIFAYNLIQERLCNSYFKYSFSRKQHSKAKPQPPKDQLAPESPFKDRNDKAWYPDAEFVKEYENCVMYPTEEFMGKKGFIKGSIPIVEKGFRTKFMNYGPAHPAAHGVLRLILELDNETVLGAQPHIGLLHRGTEKLIEHKSYLQALPYFTRLDYVSCATNELAFCLAVEKLLNIKVPPRANYLRTIFSELMRISNHSIYVGTAVLDGGGITPLFWLFEEREKMWELCERASGSRMHSTYLRIGGVMYDIPIGWCDDCYHWIKHLAHRLDEIEDVVTENRIWISRNKDVSTISAHEAINRSCSGHILRACGIKWDLRKEQPYCAYDEIDFDVPITHNGDAYDRYLIKIFEMRESIRIIEQCLNQMPVGEIKVDDFKISAPKRSEMKSGMEELIHHFKHFSQGVLVPPGKYIYIFCIWD